MSENLESIFESNWDEVKGQLKNQFGKLTSQDIKQIEGSYDIFKGKLKKTYGYTQEEIEDALTEFLSSEGFNEVKNKVKKIKEEAIDSASSFKEVIDDYLQSYLSAIKKKSIQVEENVVGYVKENPIKILGAVAVMGYGLTKLIAAKK